MASLPRFRYTVRFLLLLMLLAGVALSLYRIFLAPTPLETAIARLESSGIVVYQQMDTSFVVNLSAARIDSRSFNDIARDLTQLSAVHLAMRSEHVDLLGNSPQDVLAETVSIEIIGQGGAAPDLSPLLGAREVRGIGLSGLLLCKGDLQWMAGLHQLEKVVFVDCTLAGGCLASMPSSDSVKDLRVVDSTIEATLVDLANLSGLTDVWFDGSSFGEVAFPNVRLPPTVSKISFRDARLSDAGLVQFLESSGVGSSQFIELDLAGTQITDDALQCLAGVRLSLLDVSRTRVLDAGVESIEPQSDLRSIGLAGTDITDASLRHLSQFPSLEWIDASETKITDEGAEFLVERCRERGVRRFTLQAAGTALSSRLHVILSDYQLSELEVEDTSRDIDGPADQ